MRKKQMIKSFALGAALSLSFIGTTVTGAVACLASDAYSKYTVHGNTMMELSGYLGGSFSSVTGTKPGLEKIKDVPGEVKWQDADITVTGTSSENIVRVHFLTDRDQEGYNKPVPAGFGMYLGLGESDAEYILYSDGWTEIQPTRDTEWEIFKKGNYYVAFKCQYANLDDLYIALDGYLPLC